MYVYCLCNMTYSTCTHVHVQLNTSVKQSVEAQHYKYLLFQSTHVCTVWTVVHCRHVHVQVQYVPCTFTIYQMYRHVHVHVPVHIHTVHVCTMALVCMCCISSESLCKLTEVEVVWVLQELWQVEEFWDEFLDVGHVGVAGWLPGNRDAVEQSVREVKMAALAGEGGGRESGEVVEDGIRRSF